ncbi:MAG: glycosyltransferase family 4 protein [Acidimicrobiia bacterium]
MSARRRIGVNLLWLVPGEVGGSEEYTVRLLRAVARQRPDELDIVLYVTRSFVAAHPDLSAVFPTRVAPVSGASRPLRVLTESTWLAWRTRRDRCDVVHHAGGTMPFVRPATGIVTLHDLQPLSNPERFGPIKRRWLTWVAPRSLRAASTVICLAGFTGDDAVQRAGVDRTRVRIVPCGVDDPGAAVDGQLRQRVLTRLDLVDRPFVLYPAITYPHKNHETLVAAFAALVPTHPELRLVLTGGASSAEEVVRAALGAFGLTESVVRTGRIPEDELDVLYRSAMVMAFPSRYEGFGLPVLEAMARGCPVVASDVGGLPLVAGDAAMLVDPLDVAGWTSALAAVIDDTSRRSVLVRRGLERVRAFTWPDSATALLTVYRETR